MAVPFPTKITLSAGVGAPGNIQLMAVDQFILAETPFVPFQTVVGRTPIGPPVNVSRILPELWLIVPLKPAGRLPRTKLYVPLMPNTVWARVRVVG